MPATGLFTVLFQSLVAQINSCTMICAPIIDLLKEWTECCFEVYLNGNLSKSMCEVVKCKRRREGVSAAIKIKSLRQIDGSGSVRVCAIRSEEKKFKF